MFVDYMLIARIYFETLSYDTILDFCEECDEYVDIIKILINKIDKTNHDFYVNYLKYNKVIK